MFSYSLRLYFCLGIIVLQVTDLAIPLAATMFVSDFKTSSVLRYNADTGAFHDVFVQPRSGGLDGPWGLAFGLDHNLYVASERTNRSLSP